MNTKSNIIPIIISIGIGIIIWFGFKCYTHKSDPQSSIIYWQFGYPMLIIASLIISYNFNIIIWRWPLILIMTQMILSLIVPSGDLNLLPIGIVFHLVISIPCIIAAYCGVLLKKYFMDKAR